MHAAWHVFLPRLPGNASAFSVKRQKLREMRIGGGVIGRRDAICKGLSPSTASPFGWAPKPHDFEE
jgi:hypothetical protein